MLRVTTSRMFVISTMMKMVARAGVYCLIALCVFIGSISLVSATDQQFLDENDIIYSGQEPVIECSVDTSPSAAFGGLDGFLRALADQESGGDPKAANPTSSARGKYQYITSTWQARASLYPPSGDYSTADKAPEEVQDAVAYIEYAQIWNKYKGSVFHLAVNHFYPAANEDPSLLDKKIGSNTITPREYADSIVKKVKEGAGSNIPLKYSEAPEFDKYLSKATNGQGVFSGDTSDSGNTLPGCNTSGDLGPIEEGGLTEEQAKQLMMNYGENKSGDTERTIGASYWADCSPGGNGSNCVSFSRFFLNKFTGSPAPTPMGNGVDVVSNLAASGVPTGSRPRVFSVFSMSSSSAEGHTGVVLGIHGNTAIVGHASCTRGQNGIGGKGDGTINGDGSGFIMTGTLNRSGGAWYASGVPVDFAYPKNIDTNKIQDYINGNI
ncbi:MAG: hypothetical protein JWM00_136 [Candidatus Saccharibacteria bacterium]|nr:hypothetical protein [Candidatus Saccharibacteria bacterium]